MTFSIVARAPGTGMFGMAIASSSPAVAARCAHAAAGVGVVATQNITDPALGPAILQALSGGATAQEALRAVLAAARHAEYRQVLVLGARDAPAAHTGMRALGVSNTSLAAQSAAAGNLLARPDVPQAMTAAFESSTGHLGARLLAALRAGAAAGGEAGPVHSAGLLIVREVSWPIVDLRVDWSDADPVAQLEAVWDIYRPQIDDYVRRALDPRDAPGYGVPGSP